MSETEKPRLEVDWVKVVAGALAAVSSAVLLSTLGAAGTLIGAALGSVVVSLATSVYGTGLARGTEKVAVAQTVALEKVSAATQQIAQVRRTTADGGTGPETSAGAHAAVDPAATDAAAEEVTEALEDAEQQLEEAQAELEEAANPAAEEATSDGLTLKERLAILPWKRVLLASAGLFVIAMVLLTSFEVIGGRTVSSYTGGSDRDGGTSFGRTFRGGGDDTDQQPEQDPSRSPSPSQSPTQEPSDEPTTDPTTEPSDDPTETDDTQTADPSEDPSDTPTESESPTRTPTTRLPSPTTTSPTR
ncbi:hypothetical protein [uncultured Nocardioides sp.]|uniref:hypothetical protein n=1 Tax=uncultured Nocardioides sp. TaxID=198441 RepID=UPI002625BF3E|nr:hypothetical protein [uncultured Nocardioides sp.]